MKVSKKLLLSSLLFGMLINGCGGGSSTDSSIKTDTGNDVVAEKKGQITRSGSTQGGGDMTGAGELAPYTGVDTSTDGTGKKLFAIYMIGADLERKGEAGTNDLNELVKGYNELTEEEKSKLDIIVAFGGANKDGWKGMRFFTINQIINDSTDGKYGNEIDTAYSYVSPKANMGHASSLELFLKYVKNNYANDETKFMTLWDHGAGYGYYLGNDDYYAASETNTQHTDDVKNTFINSGLTFDLIGYDTCLNGTMEVAKATKDYSKYLLSSEELEPGHGWNYEDVIKEYAKDQDIEQFGTALVNSFINTPEHKEQDGKTLGLVNLSKYDAMQNSFNKLADIIKSMESDSPIKNVLIETLQKVRSYNESKDGAGSMDLQNFAELLSSKLPVGSATSTLAQELISNIKSYVVYSKEDGTRPNSNGVALAKLDLPGFDTSYGVVEAVSSNWLEAMQKYSKLKSNDTTAPQVTEQQADAPVDTSSEEQLARENCKAQACESYTETECLTDYGLLQNEGNYAPARSLNKNDESSLFKSERNAFIAKSKTKTLRSIDADTFDATATVTTSLNTINATVATFKDTDGNLAKVSTLYGNIIDSTFLTAAILDASKRFEGNVSGQYYTPNWNQRWYTVEYEVGKETAWIPMMFKERKLDTNTNKIVTTYVFEVDYIDSSRDYSTYNADVQFDYAQIEVVVDSNNTLLSHVIRPYTVDKIGDKEVIKFGKTIGKIKIGDKLRFYSKSFDMNTKEIFWNQESDFITLTQDFNLKIETLEFQDDNGVPLDYYYLMIAEDINGNMVFTDAIKAQKFTE
jgi:hypothetical protein